MTPDINPGDVLVNCRFCEYIAVIQDAAPKTQERALEAGAVTHTKPDGSYCGPAACARVRAP